MTTPNDNITVPRELLRQAIEALSDTQTDGDSPQWDIEKAAYDALRAALDAPAVEPIGWYWEYNGLPEGQVFFGKGPDADVIKRGLIAEFPRVVRYVYAAPQAQQPIPSNPGELKQHPAPVQEPDNLKCKSVQKRLATQWGYVEAQQPAPEINQCDGCRMGQELRNGLHFDRNGTAQMTCQAHKYQQPAPVQGASGSFMTREAAIEFWQRRHHGELPTAGFQWNPGWNTWEQVIPAAMREEGVVPMYSEAQVKKLLAERDAALKMALEALEFTNRGGRMPETPNIIDAIKEVLG